MEKLITYENIANFAYTNVDLIEGRIVGIVVHFFGLGNTQIFIEPPQEAVYYAQKNILYVHPYNDPWNWMNRRAVQYTDEVLDVLFEHLGLNEAIPIVAEGGSMGGQSALVYMAYAKRTPRACLCNCPVCDLVTHYTERPDLPRTLYGAFSEYTCDLREALESASPLHLLRADKLPDARYVIYHCDADTMVNIDLHARPFVSELRAVRNLKYQEVPGRDHCDLGEEWTKKYLEEAVECIRGE